MSQKTKTDFKMTPEQLELADKLTALQRKTVINVVKGMNYSDAYLQAGGKAKTEAGANQTASRMFRNVKVKAFYDSLLQQSVSDAIMSREEALATLSDLARGEAEDQAPKTDTGDEGEVYVYVRSTDRISALKQLSTMQGWEAPKRHEVAGGNGGKIELDVSSEQVASAVTDLLEQL